LLVFLAVVLATALNWFQLHLQRLGFRRGRAIAISISLSFFLIAGFFLIIIPPFLQEAQQLGVLIPKGLGRVEQWLDDMNHMLPNTGLDDQSIDAAKFQITNLLRLRHQIVDEDDFTIQTQKEALQIIGNISNALTLMLAAIAGISLLVGGIGIMNIMLVSVTERTQEIGLRKAIGATQRDILAQFMIEAIILSALGGLLGTGLGVGGVLLVAALTPLEAGVAPVAVVLAVGVSGSIGLFFGVVPAQRAAQLDPIVALRSA